MIKRCAAVAAIIAVSFGPAFAKCRTATAIDGHALTQFEYCTDKEYSLKLDIGVLQTAPGIFYQPPVSGMSGKVKLNDAQFPASPVEHWGRGRGGDPGNFTLKLDKAHADKLAQAINAGENFEVILSHASGTEFTAFSGAFGQKFPDGFIQIDDDASPTSETAAEPEVSAEPAALTPFQTSVVSAFDLSRPYNTYMSRSCVIDSAETHRTSMQKVSLAKHDAEITRLESEIAKAANPRSSANLGQHLKREKDQRARVAELTASKLQSRQVFGDMLANGLCRDRAATRSVILAKCEKAGRDNCACEADNYADFWMSGDYKISSSGLVSMDTKARQLCR